jgi:rhamnose transport system substrate-binding protein
VALGFQELKGAEAMKRIALAITLCLLLALAGCGPAAQQDQAQPDTSQAPLPVFALVVKDTVNPYMQVMYNGFVKACAEIGATPVLSGPNSNGAPSQEDAILKLLGDGVSVLCVAANNRDELSNALQQALKQGVTVVSLDSAVYPEDRMLHIEQAPADVVGRVLIQAGNAILKGQGQFAILTTTQNAPNQTSWLYWMEKELADKPDDYAGLQLLKIAYGKDDYKTSYQVTLDLLRTYPELDLIISPTSVGLKASADAITAVGSSVMVTGLGLPSDMQTHIISGVCPWMYLWNPSDLGYLAAYAANLLNEGKLIDTVGAIFTAGTLGERIITEASDGGTEVILDNPIMFDLTNVAVWAELF